MKIELTPIGYVQSSATEKKDEGWGTVVSSIALLPEYQAGLRGIEEFSHALIITYLHEAYYESSRHLLRRPRGLSDMPEVGIFAQRAKDRPNPIGVTAASIIRTERGSLVVSGLDAINGTPVLDIKPYYPHYDHVEGAKVPEWVQRLMRGYF